MKIGIIIVRYEESDTEVQRFSEEISALGFTDYSLYCIDQRGTSYGFAHGVNEGLQKAAAHGCDVFIVANIDISFNLKTKHKEESDRTIEDQIKEMAGRYDVFGFAFLQKGVVYEGGMVDPRRYSAALVRQEDHTRRSMKAVEWISGSFMGITAHVYRTLGGFDEGYGMYYEDVDYSVRALRAGFALGCSSMCLYEHFEQSSDLGIKKRWWLFRNHFRFMLRFAPLSVFLYELMRAPKTVFEARAILLWRLLQTHFLKNFVSLNVSSVINKALFFVLFLFLTRTLEPSEYGLYALIWAHVGLFSPFLDLGTTTYGIVYGSTRDNAPILNNVLSLRVLMGGLVFFASIFLSLIVGYDNLIIRYITAASVIMLSNALSGSFLILTSLTHTVYRSSVFSVVFNAVFVGISIIAGTFFGLKGIFTVAGVGYAVFAILNYGGIRYWFPERRFTDIDFNAWKHILGKSWTFILIGLFAGIYFRIDLFLLHKLSSEGAVGVYAAGYKFYDALLFLAASYNIAATPVFAKLRAQNMFVLVQRIQRDMALLFILGVVVALGGIVVAPAVIGLLKPAYAPSVPVLRIVILALPFLLSSSVIMNTLYIFEKARVVLVLFILQAVVSAVLNITLIPRYSFYASAWITVLSEVFSFIILSIYLYRMMQRKSVQQNNQA